MTDAVGGLQRELQRPPCRIAKHLALANVCDVPAAVAELHDAFPFSCERPPPRTSFRILLDPKKPAPSMRKRHCAKMLCARESDRVLLTAQCHLRLALTQDLTPH